MQVVTPATTMGSTSGMRLGAPIFEEEEEGNGNDENHQASFHDDYENNDQYGMNSHLSHPPDTVLLNSSSAASLQSLDASSNSHHNNSHHAHRHTMHASTGSIPSCASNGSIHNRDVPRSGNDLHHHDLDTSSPFGLLLSLEEGTGHVQLTFCQDAGAPDIHPNVRVPASFSDLHTLAGGGSGVAVFAGTHPSLGEVVMKHGDHKDLQELFALATISQELTARANMPGGSQHVKDERIRAARHLRYKIPEFKCLYISPHHLGEKRRALWQKLTHLYKTSTRNIQYSNLESGQPVSLSSPTNNNDNNDAARRQTVCSGNLAHHKRNTNNSNGSLASNSHGSNPSLTTAESNGSLSSKNRLLPNHNHNIPRIPKSRRRQTTLTELLRHDTHRDISVYASNNRHSKCSVKLQGDSLNLVLPKGNYRVGEEEQQQHEKEEHATMDVSELFAALSFHSTQSAKNKQPPKKTTSQPQSSYTITLTGPNGGYPALQSICDDLLLLMQEHRWKVTLGQKKIGPEGETSPSTGNMWLYRGQLEKRLLDNLIRQNINLIRDLEWLTRPEEKDHHLLQRVREEVAHLEESYYATADELSDEADSFVGKAIKKNFKAETGRFPVLMMLGKQFREHTLIGKGSAASLASVTSGSSDAASDTTIEPLVILPQEELPAYHLGVLTRPGALMSDTFANVQEMDEATVLDTMNPMYYRYLLRQAVLPRTKNAHKANMALRRIWTCGLTDAGLHNLFLSEDKLWLFDLGETQVYSTPGFLTKFLFSFFHTLGMEEDPAQEGDDGQRWVRRFMPCSGGVSMDKLTLTPETAELLPKAYTAFETCLDQLNEELFHGDDSMRWLLIQYVTLQLCSDASFCLQKWTVKGGGRAREANHQKGIEKWLWRALWDIYVAFDINTRESWSRLQAEHPAHRESTLVGDMREILNDESIQAYIRQAREEAIAEASDEDESSGGNAF